MKSLIPWRQKEKDAIPAVWNDDWFDRALWSPFTKTSSLFPKPFFSGMPSVDVSEDKDEVTVRAEVPGLTEKDLELTWHDGILRIRGEKKAEKEEKKKGRYFRECSYGSFSRDIELGNSVDWKGAKAKYKHGVLNVSLPKTEKARKAIEIKVN